MDTGDLTSTRHAEPPSDLSDAFRSPALLLSPPTVLGPRPTTSIQPPTVAEGSAKAHYQAGSEHTEEASRPGWRWSWEALAYRDFRLYFTGSVISNLGTWLQNTAQALLAYQMTHSVLGIGAVVCAQFLWVFSLARGLEPW